MVFHFVVVLGDDQEVCRSYRSSGVFALRSCWKALLKRRLSLMRFSRHDLDKIITTDSLCGKKKAGSPQYKACRSQMGEMII